MRGKNGFCNVRGGDPDYLDSVDRVMNGWDLQADKAEYFEILENMENEHSNDDFGRIRNWQEYVNAESVTGRHAIDSDSKKTTSIPVERMETR